MENYFFIFIALFLGFLGGCKATQSNKSIKNNEQVCVGTEITSLTPTKESWKFNVLLLTVPDSTQRYSPGDYFWNRKNQLVIKVSEIKNWKYSYLVAFHELIETQLCIEHGITVEQIDAFDSAWVYVPGSGIEEPGADPRAPYHKEHVFALKMERLMAEELGVDWDTYNAAMEKMQQ